jgi:hypothetical protein
MAETRGIRVMAIDDHPLMMAGNVGEINAQLTCVLLQRLPMAMRHWGFFGNIVQTLL